ncbi:heterokaryon incompatibility protein-domain-containing protein [Xylogone sp. PMI_703]|nr:heterokaryon incompatibility protein-domain-containing protein [Xylogone sp. PMI_703]
MASYPYRELRHNETRILTISPGQFEDPINCCMSHMSLYSEREQYEALSYCWSTSVIVDKVPDKSEIVTFSVFGDGLDESGDVEFQDTLDHPYLHSHYIRCGGTLPPGIIVCDGMELTISGELHRAIKRLRSGDKLLRIWIDAICINQGDIQERNRHVKMMGSIYARAARVRIWLGEEIGIESESILVLECANQILTDAIQAVTPNGSTRFNIERHLKKDTRTSELAWESLAVFFSRAWFQRIWVIQEIANAPDATVHIGNFSLDWTWLSTIVSAARFYKMDRVFESDSVKAICVMDWLARQKTGDDQLVAVPLLDALEETRAFQSTLTIDKIYGTLGLVDDSEIVLVDYAQDGRDAFKQLAVSFLMERRSLDMLCHCVHPKESSSLNLPSWVADWTAPGWVEPFRSRRLPANAASGAELRLTIDESEEVLSIWGKAIDKIAAVDDVKSIPSPHPSDTLGSWFAAKITADENSIATSVKEAVDSEHRNNVREQEKLANDRDSLKNILAIAFSGLTPTDQMIEALAQTFMCNRTTEGKRADELSSLGLNTFVTATFSDEPIENTFQAMVAYQQTHHGLGRDSVEQYYSKVKQAFQIFIGSYTKWCHNRRFFRTNSGYFGWGNHEVKPGDVVSCSNSDATFTFRDFELMHQWVSSTGESLVSGAAMRRAMKQIVPQLAMTQIYLMHSIMAISALHIAYLRPSQAYAYRLLAAHHENLGLPLFRTAITCINEGNCDAIYACGHLVLKYAFATPDLDLGAVSEWVTLVRAYFSVNEYAMRWLRNGSFSASLEKPVVMDTDLSKNPEDSRFAQLVSVLEINQTADIEHCRHALDILRRLLTMASFTNPPVSINTMVYTWPYKISQRYIELVTERKPEALLVLAHYCILMKKIEDFWYMNGCAGRILDRCQRDLSPEWRSFLEWPASVIFNRASTGFAL